MTNTDEPPSANSDDRFVQTRFRITWTRTSRTTRTRISPWKRVVSIHDNTIEIENCPNSERRCG